MNSYFKYYIYISFIFLIVWLFKAEYLIIPDIKSYYSLAFAILLLFLAFVFEAFMWKDLLLKLSHPIHINQSIASVGLSVFGKYIPGKIWMIMGKAAYISETYNIPMKGLSFLSLQMQLIISWVGLIFGAIGLLLINGVTLFGWTIIFIWIFLSLLIFTDYGETITEYVSKTLFRRKIEIHRFSFRSTLSVLPWAIIIWINYSIGLGFLINSTYDINYPLHLGLGFPLAATLGVIAVFSPAGLGVREGVLIGYFSLAGFSLVDATSIAVVSRLWILVGEILIFIAAILSSKYSKRLKL